MVTHVQLSNNQRHLDGENLIIYVKAGVCGCLVDLKRKEYVQRFPLRGPDHQTILANVELQPRLGHLARKLDSGSETPGCTHDWVTDDKVVNLRLLVFG